MSERERLIIGTKKNSLMETSVSKQLSFWEMDDDSETKASHITVDTVGTPPPQYKDIPAVVNFLNKVYEKRVLKGELDLNPCPHCKAVLPHDE